MGTVALGIIVVLLAAANVACAAVLWRISARRVRLSEERLRLIDERQRAMNAMREHEKQLRVLQGGRR